MTDNKKYKKFIPCITLLRGNAVRGLKDDTIVSTDPTALAKTYAHANIDAIIVFDRSADGSDAEHDAAIEQIREISAAVHVPVIGAGHINRMEDVKKLIYAGCSSCALNYSKQSNIDLTKEVSDKFGRDKISVCYRHTDDVLSNKELIEKYVKQMILIDADGVGDVKHFEGMPTVIDIPDVSLDKIIELLGYESIDGITGNAVNDNIDQLSDVKKLCSDNGIAVNKPAAEYKWSDLKKGSDGLVPVVVQEDSTDQVLMVAYMNEESYNMTIQTGVMTYYSRSRQELWVKGETSGHYQYVRSIFADCDLDTLLAKVDQIGAACHTGSHSCFFNRDYQTGEPRNNPEKVLEEVYDVIQDRKIHPKEGSYTDYLFEKGIDKQLKKLGEESTEIVIAAKNPDKTDLVYEMADYLYHMMVVMATRDVSWKDITEELARREQSKKTES